MKRLCENSIERVINLSIERLSHSSHHDAMTAHDDLVELKKLMTQIWVAAQNAVIAKVHNMKE